MEEIWKDIKDYENIYQISNLGNAKSFKFGKEKMMKPAINKIGYLSVNCYKNGKMKNLPIHQLVAVAFLNHITDGYKLVVNHKDFNKLNNKVSNLEIVTARENTNKKHKTSSSKYTGVYWNKRNNKWFSQILINRKRKYLGLFESELEASETYQKELKNINN